MCRALLLGLAVSWPAILTPVSIAEAGAPACYTYGSAGYCQYDGLVARAYINSGNFLLIYFDAPLNLSSVASVGITGVTQADACGFPITENPDYAKMLFAAALAAQARGATVSLQLWGSASGYIRCDRIWTNP